MGQRLLRLAIVAISFVAVGVIGLGAQPASAGVSAAGTGTASQIAPSTSHTAHARVVKINGVRPNSASGCNQQVCIWVCNNSSCTGSGLYIDHVYSEAYPTAYGCAAARFQVNGVVWATSNTVCGGTNTVFQAWWYPKQSFANQTQLCVYWFGSPYVPGRPCETVHS